MLREATSSSLLVLDEFGQGTSHVDGTALFIACMEHWIYQANHSPLILAASHLHYAAGYLSKSLAATNTRFNSMGYTCNKGELIFLYQPVPDLCGNSFPFTVARGAGVPSSIISRSKEVIHKKNHSTHIITLAKLELFEQSKSVMRRSLKHQFATVGKEGFRTKICSLIQILLVSRCWRRFRAELSYYLFPLFGMSPRRIS